MSASSSSARRRATYADVLAAPEHLVAEVIAGELSLLPRPATPHASATSTLGGELAQPFGRGKGGPGGWLLVDEPELHLGEDVVVPDLAGWRRERLPRLPRAPYVELAPDWVCEALSPSTARLDRIDKLPVYARAAVPWIWLVDALARTLEVYELAPQKGKYVLLGGWAQEARVRAPPFEAFELELGVLWADVEQG